MRIAHDDQKQASKSKLGDGDQSLATLKQWYESFEDATANARTEAELDRDYYDGIQWTAEEVAELERRNQPVITINRIAPKINFIVGSEIAGRTDPRAYPRNPNADAEAADACTDALRYVDDAEELDSKFSEDAEDGFVQGAAGVVVEIDKETLDPKVRVIHWDRLWYDPHSRKRDFSDAKYLGVVDWLDYDEALEFYGEKAKAVLDATAAGDNDKGPTTHDDRPGAFSWYDAKRERIKVCEVYWREGSKHYYAHFTGGGFLSKPAVSPYVDELGNPDCPIVAWSAFVNRQNERYGIVRSMRSPQDEVNKRRSKALHLLSVRQVVADKGAVEHPESARHELARPDGYVEVTPGLRFDPLPNSDFTMGQMQLLAEAKGEIDAVGPSAATAMESNAASGRLFLARQNAANQQLLPAFDALRRFKRNTYRKVWFRIRQFWTEEKWVRVRDDEEKQGFRFVGLNRRMTRAERLQELLEKGTPLPAAVGMLGIPNAQAGLAKVQQGVAAQLQAAQQQGAQVPPDAAEGMLLQVIMQLPEMQAELVANEISRLDVDIILDESPDTTVLEQEEFEQLGAIGPTLIQAGFPAPMFAELLIEASQFRNRRKMLEIVRNAAGPNPEAAQAQQQAQMLGQQKLVAEIQKTQAQAKQAESAAVKNIADAQTAPAKAMGEQAYAMKTAAEAGRATVPEAPQPPPGREPTRAPARNTIP